ncbi:MAG: O-methyltransferase, partial [Candidatus Hodarchaeales archaeon]
MKDSDLLLNGLTDYINNLLPERSEVFQEIEIMAGKNDFPIIGPHIGQFLMLITRLMGAKRIIELGSGFGYSALWFAKGIQEDAEIICTDKSGDNAEKAKHYFTR